MKNIILITFAVLILVAYPGTRKPAPMEISTFTLFDTVSFDKDIFKAPTIRAPRQSSPCTTTPKKSCSGEMAGRSTLWRDGEPTHKFPEPLGFRHGKRLPHLCLDSAAKVIKKFNADGKLLGTMELGYVQQPTKIALGNQQNIYVYDSASGEIIAYDLLDKQELYRFGKFDLNKVDILYANRDYVVAFDSVKGQSSLFSALGQFVSHDSGQLVYDAYNNAISLSSDALVSKMSAAWLPMTPGVGLMTISGDVVSIVVGNQVRLLKLDYAPVL
jgi:hypothetical protein